MPKQETSWRALHEMEGVLREQSFNIHMVVGALQRLNQRVRVLSEPDREELVGIVRLTKELEEITDRFYNDVYERLNDR